jgi:hypothetical protein
MCVYIYVYVYMYIYTHTYTHIHMRVHVYVCVVATQWQCLFARVFGAHYGIIISGAVVGGVGGLGLAGLAFFMYRRYKVSGVGLHLAFTLLLYGPSHFCFVC